jgi:GT2 family glycosyltransferase
MIQVSVIVATCNRIDRLKLCISSLLNQTYPETNYEIIVTDDGSTDGTREYMATLAQHDRVRYLWHPNVGTAGNRNIGIRNATGELILFIDDDVEATRDLIARHAGLHARQHTPTLVVLGYAPFAPALRRSAVIRYREAIWNSLYDRADTWPEQKRYQLVITNNLSLSRAFLVRAGCFDEQFRNATHEDTELGYRLMQIGMTFMFCRDAVAYHHFRISPQDSLIKERRKGEAQVLFDRRHPELGTEFSLDILAPKRSRRPLVNLWRRCKWALYNRVTTGLLTFMSRLVPLPPRLNYRVLGIIHWYYYILGLKDGARLVNAGTSPEPGSAGAGSRVDGESPPVGKP